MLQRPGFEKCDGVGKSLVFKLNKALYALKQAPRAWFERFKHLLFHTLHLTVSLADSHLFIKKFNSGTIFLLIYVDDIVVRGSDSSAVKAIISQIHSEFKLKD